MTMTLEQVAQAMVAPGKGILAADESSGTIKKRFDSIGLAATEDSRRDYRELLFRADEAMKNHISGVILYDETIRQKAKDGTPLIEIIAKSGAVPGIKVDAGADVDDGAPLGELGAELDIFLDPLGQAVQALGHDFSRTGLERLGAAIHLDARQ